MNNLPNDSSQIKELLKKNLELTEEIFKMTKSIKHFVIWQKVTGVIKILLIAAPIIIGIIYLPPLIKNLLREYQSFLNVQGINSGDVMKIFDSLKSAGNANNINPQNIDINNPPPELKKILK